MDGTIDRLRPSDASTSFDRPSDANTSIKHFLLPPLCSPVVAVAENVVDEAWMPVVFFRSCSCINYVLAVILAPG